MSYNHTHEGSTKPCTNLECTNPECLGLECWGSPEEETNWCGHYHRPFDECPQGPCGDYRCCRP